MPNNDATSAAGPAAPLNHAQWCLLADYVDGLLTGPEHEAARDAVRRLLFVSAEARDTEQWLRRTTEVASRVPLVPRSPVLEQRLRRCFLRWSDAEQALVASKQVSATIIADSRHDRPLAGVRGASDTVTLVYACELGELALDLRSGNGDTVTIDGQLLLDAHSDAPYFGVRALGTGFNEATETDELGHFYFQNLPTRPMRLRLDNGEVEISALVDLDPVDAGSAISP